MKNRLILLIVAMMLPGSTACQKKNPVEPDTGSFFSSKRVIKTALADYGHHSLDANYKTFISNNFDYIISGDRQLDFAFYKNINSDIVIFCYFNSYLHALDQPAPASERAYLHDLSNPANKNAPTKRLGRFFENDFYYAMNPGSSEWQAHSLKQINNILNNGFDGVHIDDVFSHLMHEDHFGAGQPMVIGRPDNYSEFSTVPAWYDAQQSHTDWKAYLAFLKQNIAEKIIFNGVNDLAENLQPINPSYHPINYLDVTDGSVHEGFVYNGKWVANPDDGFWGDEYWEAIVDQLIKIPADKIHGVVSYGDANYWKSRIYSFASFLIGYDPDRTVAFSYTANEFTLTYLPEWSLNIGAPVESFSSVLEYKDSGINIFSRKFENALVLVNPYSAATREIAVDAGYYLLKKSGDVNIKTIDGRIKVAIGENDQLKFEPVSSVQLQGYSAVILMKNNPISKRN